MVKIDTYLPSTTRWYIWWLALLSKGVKVGEVKEVTVAVKQ
jgi:hypothetical protein